MCAPAYFNTMSIINSTYFEVPQRQAPKSGIINLQTYIEKYEPEILKDCLGVELYRVVTADVLPYEVRISKLVNGEDYINGDLVEYKGLKNMIADYVYMKLIADLGLTLTLGGVVAAKPTDSNNAGVSGIMYRVDSQVYEAFYECQQYLSLHASTYPEWQFQTYTKGYSQYGI